MLLYYIGFQGGECNIFHNCFDKIGGGYKSKKLKKFR